MHWRTIIIKTLIRVALLRIGETIQLNAFFHFIDSNELLF